MKDTIVPRKYQKHCYAGLKKKNVVNTQALQSLLQDLLDSYVPDVLALITALFYSRFIRDCIKKVRDTKAQYLLMGSRTKNLGSDM